MFGLELTPPEGGRRPCLAMGDVPEGELAAEPRRHQQLSARHLRHQCAGTRVHRRRRGFVLVFRIVY
jgi:hypothetical protein